MINNFSPNMLKTYMTCPKKFYYQYIASVKVPLSSVPFEKGKKIHALANYFLQGVNISRIETALNEEERRVWNLLLNNKYFQKDYLKSEYQLFCKLGKFWIGGRLDAVVQDEQNYYILDYKTGAVPKNPEFDPQTMVYLLSLDKALSAYDSISFVYINLKDNVNYVVDFTPELKVQYEQKLLKICELIAGDTVYNCNCESCARCEYFKICSNCFVD